MSKMRERRNAHKGMSPDMHLQHLPEINPPPSKEINMKTLGEIAHRLEILDGGLSLKALSKEKVAEELLTLSHELSVKAAELTNQE